MSLKKIDSNIKRIVTNANKLNMLIHETGMLVLEHAAEHGDCTRALTLVKAMPASMRRTMLILWFNTYSPIRVNLNNDKVGLLKDGAKGYVPFNIDGARETPFFQLAEENPEKSYDFAALVKMVERIGKQIEKKIEDGKVPAEDVPSAKAIAVRVAGLKFERMPVAKQEPANETNTVVNRSTEVRPAPAVAEVQAA